MSYINNNIDSAESGNIREYKLIIPEHLVSFREVFVSVLRNKGVEVDVGEVWDALNIDKISRMSAFDIVADIGNDRKLLGRANVIASIAVKIRSICDDEKLHKAVCAFKEVVQILTNYKGGGIYFFDIEREYLREGVISEVCSSRFIDKLEKSLSEGGCKNDEEEVVLVDIKVKEEVIGKVCDVNEVKVNRPWLEDLIYPLRDEVLERIGKCHEVGIRYSYNHREMHKVIVRKYVVNMLEKGRNKEYSEGFKRQLPSKEAFCGTDKTGYKTTRVISGILKPIMVGEEEVIFPWLEFIDYVARNVDKLEGSEEFSEEYLSGLIVEFYRGYKFYRKYKRYYKDKEITERISEIKKKR